MSRGRWLQTVGQVAKQPIAVRFRGVPAGSEEAQRLAAALAPRISHFQKSQWDNREQSGLAVYKKTRREPGLTMTYSYVSGQETMYIEVSGGLRKQISDTVHDFWDYALIELYVPNRYAGEAGSLVCFAHLSAPLQQELTEPLTFPVEGLATSYSPLMPTQTATDRLINGALPPHTYTADPGSATETYASFTLDLGPLRRGAALVDLYPAFVGASVTYPASAIYTPQSNEWSSSSTRPDLQVPDIETNYNIVMVDEEWQFDDLGFSGITGTGAEVWTVLTSGLTKGFAQYAGETRSKSFPDGSSMTWSVLPETYFDDADLTWKFVASNDPIYNEPLGPFTDYDGSETVPVYRHWWVSTGPTEGYVPPTYPPEGIPGEVKVTLFKGRPGTAVALHSSHYRWAFPGMFPVHPGGGKVADVFVPVIEDLPSALISDFYGIPKIGSVGIDTWRIRPEQPGAIHGAWWQAP